MNSMLAEQNYYNQTYKEEAITRQVGMLETQSGQDPYPRCGTSQAGEIS